MQVDIHTNNRLASSMSSDLDHDYAAIRRDYIEDDNHHDIACVEF